jgi:hypothetical protein
MAEKDSEEKDLEEKEKDMEEKDMVERAMGYMILTCGGVDKDKDRVMIMDTGTKEDTTRGTTRGMDTTAD